MNLSEPITRRRTAIGTIWHLAGDKRGVLARSIAFKALQATFEALPVALLAYLINELRADDLGEVELVVLVSVIVVCVVCQWCAGFVANRSAWIATFELFGWLRARLVAHLRALPMAFHDRKNTGNVLAVLTQDVSSVESFTHEPLQMMIGAVVAPFVVFLVLSFQDQAMAAATLVSVVCAVPAFMWTNRVFIALAGRRQALQATASGRLIEYLQGLPVIRAFGLAGARLVQLEAAMRDFHQINLAMAAKLAPLGSMFLSVVFLGIPIVLLAGTYWLLGGTLDAATFLIFAILSLRVYLPLVAATQGFESMRIADASLDRIADMFAQPVDHRVEGEGRIPQRFDVRFDHVTFSYDKGEPALRDVSLSAKAGELTAVVGPSGSGKTTLLQLVSGLRVPQSGSVAIGDIPLPELSPERCFDAVTHVFQEVYLFPGSVFDNIAFGRREATREAVVEAAKLAQAHEFIDALPNGYDSVVHEGGANFSGGERQRLSIARAILKDAPIVLLDEATSALDATNERLVQEAIAALVREKTVMVVAHRLATIKAADQILVVDDGQIVQRGDHAELMAEPGLYRDLWDARARAAAWQVSN